MRTYQEFYLYMKRAILSSMALLLMLSSAACFVQTYQPSPSNEITVSPSSDKDKWINFFYYSGETVAKGSSREEAGPLPLEFGVLQHVLEENVGIGHAVVTPTTPDQGIFLNVYATALKPSSVAKLFCGISVATLTALPCYNGTGGYNVRYDLYIDKKLKKSYQYDITRKGALWIGFLPFSWINLLTTSYEDALEAVSRQFLIDSKQDGYF